ncbi:PQQ-dependent dehydrogenase, methanol/ethanol family [Fulvimarina sp. 2208YS6-2-32]|uniref:PQQ-dependent dehydrogenase, methanol/ethanol family n=1 Tax=Fulvimarina uroteuthidis TaxID=3098149 RepID=A0ABU5I1M3_9HYPH|nr:PQQ-dependent dehydrogenase, methanol/ethanol family [Fulvimarina sp. 2208YS6-2-32]MDY8109264.1 PQQ-dependent dehydrogenase, methanol/ethanol family [Fulvimarina sp. 2208YS6-2-32]
MPSFIRSRRAHRLESGLGATAAIGLCLALSLTGASAQDGEAARQTPATDRAAPGAGSTAQGEGAETRGADAAGAGAPRAGSDPSGTSQGASQAQGAEDLAELSKDPNQWIMPSKTYDGMRYSELDQINTENVGDLQLAWTFSNGINRGQESIPLVVDGLLYIVSPWPNNLFALDATTGDLKWAFKPPTERAAQGVACCDVVNRGATYASGKIIYNTLDSHTVAVDAKTGELVWNIKLGEISNGQTMTMAPLVVKDKVLVGNSGGEMGVRGWMTALDVETGDIVWQAMHTGTDAEVLIGEDFEAPYPWMEGTDLGVKTWPRDRWKTGGGTAWGWITYDPELDLVYYGTGNPGPWNSNQRKGDNLWTATIFARDPDTGQAKWAYQTSPHDLWDHDGVNEVLLLDLEIDGETRKTAVRPGRNGFMYVLDRTSGKVISADPFDKVTVYEGVDMETGKLIPVAEKDPVLGKTITDICPAPPGAKDWQPTAYSPRTRLLYVPHQTLCASMTTSDVSYISGTPYLGATVDMYAGTDEGTRGQFMAWDLVKRMPAWQIREEFPVYSGTVATAGDVAFYGTMDRWFKAVDARNGEILWQFRAPSGIIGQPSTFMGSDGRQYVAIMSGVGGWAGAVATAELDGRVRNGALGFVGAMQDLPAYTTGGSTLMVFALPDAGDRQEAGAHPEVAQPQAGDASPGGGESKEARDGAAAQ